MTQYGLRIVLEKVDIQVENVITQYSMKNIKGRSVRLDIYATDKSTILRFSVLKKVPEPSGQDRMPDCHLYSEPARFSVSPRLFRGTARSVFTS